MAEENKTMKKMRSLQSELCEVANLRKEMSMECQNLLENNLNLMRENAEKLVILKSKTDVQRFITNKSLEKPLESYFDSPSNLDKIHDIFNMLRQVKEDQEILIEACKHLD